MPSTLRLAVTILATSELTVVPSAKVQTDPAARPRWRSARKRPRLIGGGV